MRTPSCLAALVLLFATAACGDGGGGAADAAATPDAGADSASDSGAAPDPAPDAGAAPDTDSGAAADAAPDSASPPDALPDPGPDGAPDAPGPDGPPPDIALPDIGPGPGPGDYPEALLCPPEPHDDPRCGPVYDPATAMSQAELEAAYAAGLQAWRFEGLVGACASCHSPDGIELARVGFADADLKRRAKGHVDEATADAIVTFIHAQRQRYGMTRVLHPDAFRPLQPTYLAFEGPSAVSDVGESKGQAERDTLFTEHLTGTLKLLWATGKVDSLAKAHQAYDELLAVDLPQLPLGIPFDRLSEDHHFGEPHASVFEWFPGIPSPPTAAGSAAWYAAVDKYLVDPTETNLWAYYDAIDTATACDYDLSKDGDPDYYGRACEWMRLKWKSLQVVAHMLRHGQHAMPDPLADQGPGASPVDHLELMIARQPVWEAGDFVRVAPLMRPPQTACFKDDNHPCTFLPPAIDETVHSNPSYEEARIKQSQIFQQSWFVMSRLRDPALVTQSESFATFVGDYLESVLLPYYDVHHAFVVARMAVSKAAATAWFDAPGFRNGLGKIASVRTFSFKQIRNNFSPPPEGDPRREVHERMFANFARMWIYLVEEDLQLSGTIYDKTDVMYAVRFMRTWIAELEGAEDPAINALVLSIEALAAAATELRSQDNEDDYPGTGLQPNGDWGEFSQPYTGG